ncbi:hypothetical protein OG474_00825 [Kribbella sp. NBC_01505]|uniref:hypothetical protein n=1 Tax=Kribbella sp. NBC_01505 TaxID=2903580 RepID=UPI00386B4C98
MSRRVLRIGLQFCVVLPLTFLIVNAGPPARAATVVQPQTGVLMVSAAPGKANQTTATSDRESALAHDESDSMIPSSGCIAVDAKTVRCPILNLSKLRIDLGDLTTSLRRASSVPESCPSSTATPAATRCEVAVATTTCSASPTAS